MIDNNTIQQILDAADIVEVVSDFVSLKRKGANYMGLCPFHNEKTPSFAVSKSKGICKCFSCGKGGSAVGFIMEHEQLSYVEALRYLANKYHIELHERELTEEEKEAQSERESMLSINEFAQKEFAENLLKSEEGQNIGLSYFHERGITDQSIKKFRLGYSLDIKDDLFKKVKNAGYNIEHLVKTGLCSKSSYGDDSGFDKFKGRVMFPVLNVAGKVIAFGGRTLKNEPAKYINSPESLIYKKSNELYGLFQAKQAISKYDKCFLVEGYTDVISMHQSGIENVVASSGTSLTEGQIRMIHRFTNNVTVLYDGDSAGIKASLRGIDMLLAEGLNIKVLLLPDGEDPDSFARSRSASELISYIQENETDFIKFKTRILLEGTNNDPIKKSAVISDIVKSIAIIPSQISQAVYAQECSRLLEIDEKLLLREIAKAKQKNKEKEFEQKERQKRDTEKKEIENVEYQQNSTTSSVSTSQKFPQVSSSDNPLSIYEDEIIRIIIRYGMAVIAEDNNQSGMTIIQYINEEMHSDGIEFSNLSYKKIFDTALSLITPFNEALSLKEAELLSIKEQKLKDGIKKISNEAIDFSDIENKEQQLRKDLGIEYNDNICDFRCKYLSTLFCSSPDDEIRQIAIRYVSDKHKLSKMYEKSSVLVSEYDKLTEYVPMAINNWKSGIISYKIKLIQERLRTGTCSEEEVANLLVELQRLNNFKIQFAAVLGERVIVPKCK